VRKEGSVLGRRENSAEASSLPGEKRESNAVTYRGRRDSKSDMAGGRRESNTN